MNRRDKELRISNLVKQHLGNDGIKVNVVNIISTINDVVNSKYAKYAIFNNNVVELDNVTYELVTTIVEFNLYQLELEKQSTEFVGVIYDIMFSSNK